MTLSQGTFTQAGNRVTVREYLSLQVGGIRFMDQISLFGGEKEEHSVYESEHLLKILLRREIAVSDGFPQIIVVLMFQKTVADLSQGFRDAVAEIFPCAFARFMGFGPPDFHDAVRRLVVVGLQAAGVSREPESREVRIYVFRENQVQVRFDIGRSGQTRVVAKDSQFRPVGNDSPERDVFRVQILLHQSVRRFPASFMTETRVGLVKIEVTCRKQKGHGVSVSLMGKLKDSVANGDAFNLGQDIVSEDRTQQMYEPFVYADLPCVQITANAVFGIIGIEILGHAPVPADLFFQHQRL